MEQNYECYYRVEEMYRKEEGSNEWIRQVHHFDEGPIMKRRWDAINFTFERYHEIGETDKGLASDHYESLYLLL